MKTTAYISMVIGACVLGLFMLRDIAAELKGPETLESSFVESDPSGQSASTNQSKQIQVVLNAETENRIKEILNPSPPMEPDSDINIATTEPVAQSELELPTQTESTVTEVKAATSSSSNAVSAPPVRQQTPMHPDMITPGNFIYLGGFRPEFGDGNAERFGLGGWAITFRPDGDANGPRDGHPGSLFLMGHRHQQLIAEINIPTPFVSTKKNIDDLPVAKVLQPFADITSGLRTKMTNGSSEPFEIGGLQVVGTRLHWTLYKYYNVNQVDYLSHGLTTTNLSDRAFRGLWHLGPHRSGDSRWHSYKNAGYIAEIPKSIADGYLDGMNLMSGLQISTGRQTSSQGPALYAYKVEDENLHQGGSLPATPLLWYPMDSPMTGHHPADSWQGAAWLTLGKKQAVIVVGRKGLGPVHYGMPRPGECYDYKGYHASQYETQVLFYRPQDILAGAKKSVPNKDPWYRWNSETPGGSLNRFMYQHCGKEIGGIAYDRDNNLLYVSEINAGLASVNAYEALPVIHVLKIVN